MSSRTPSPSRTGRDKHFPNKHDTHASDSPQKKIVSNMKENENEAGENGSKDLPIFRGPEGGTMKYDIKELKRITVRIERSLPKPEVARKILDPKTIAPVRRPDEGKQPLFSRIAASSSTNSSAEPSSSNKPIERDKRKTRSRSPTDYHYRHRSSKRSSSPSSKRRYHSPTPPHYRHRHSSRYSPGRDAHHESKRGSKRSSSSERDLRKASSSDRDYIKRERRRSSSRSPHRYKERSSRDEEERDRHHGRRRSSDRDERDRRSRSNSREPTHSSQRDHSYQSKSRMPESGRQSHMLEPHPGMMPMGPMVMGPVMHPFTPFVPPVMVRPPPPGFRPFRPGPFRPLPFRPQRNPRNVPPRSSKNQPNEEK
ncbi:hypothetical protein O3M35_007415 [Rhynocoris fuscipes]|uniref:Complementary sex determination N-terminal domain-containing protein n=1 Tax=Rhynocoris fuscipes TaxID=488301 RepID=A0AAW1DAR7_9HEMI